MNYQAFTGGYIISTEGWSPSNHGFSLRLNGSKLNFAIGDGTSSWKNINSTTTLTANTWYHAAVTCTATEMKMYINGILEATTTLTSPMVASTEKITIGDSPAWPGRLLNGKIADLRFWNVVRTQAQITDDMTSTPVGTETGLVAGWKMNEDTGTSVADIKGTYNLTKPADAAGITWFDQEIIAPVKGLIFDSSKSNSLIDFGQNAAIASATQFTVEALSEL